MITTIRRVFGECWVGTMNLYIYMKNNPSQTNTIQFNVD